VAVADFISILEHRCRFRDLNTSPRISNLERNTPNPPPPPYIYHIITMADKQPPQDLQAPQGSQGPQGPQIRLQPGQQPTPDQIAAMQRQLEIDAKKNGMTVPQFIAKLKEQAMAQQQAQQQAAQQQQAQQQQQPINPGPPNPAAIAVAKFLKGQDLKMRTCILNGQRKDMFKGQLLC
jgi:hypothetical protein